MSEKSTDWPRRNQLLDEVVDMPADLRPAWLAALQLREPLHAEVVTKMLADFENATDGASHPTSLVGVGANEFAASLENATATNMDEKNHKGDMIGPWQLSKKIGQGGMGAVWLAIRQDGNFSGMAAIKFIHTRLGKTEVLNRFLRERRLLARLTHPNIARLIDAGTLIDEPYLVMEYVDGIVITDWACEHAPTVTERITLILKVCRAVEYAHTQLIVHRDLKPSNVLVNSRGEPSLLDFGIAKLVDDDADDDNTALTRLTGRGYTLGYCAPEQITGEPTGVAADVFSIGVLLFELLTGAMPYKPEREGRAALEHAIVHGEAKNLSRVLDEKAGAATTLARQPEDADKARGDIEAIVAKALRKQPEDRYATVSALADDLSAWLSQTPISIRREDRQYRAKLWVKRNWQLAALACVAVIAITAGLTISVWQRSEALAAASLAKEEAARANKVADYLGELIQSASPDNHGGTWPTVLALLEQSEKDLDKQFADDAKTHALLLKKLADTNDALNRNPTALAQLTQLHALLVKTQSADSDDAMNALKQRAQLLYRMDRHNDAMEIGEALLPKFVKRYGAASEEVGKLLMDTASPIAQMGNMDLAKARMVEGAAILTKLYPNDLAKRIDIINEAAVLLTQKAMWRDAMNTLATIERDLPAMAKLGGQKVRDSLVFRRNLESIRVRVGSYDGVEQRLNQIIREFDVLLGKDNLNSGMAMGILRTLYCETGRFEACMSLAGELIVSRQRQKGMETLLLDDEINLLGVQLRTGRLPPSPAPSATARAAQLFAAIPKTLTEPSADRAGLYRQLADGAINAGVLTLAQAALSQAREDMAKINSANPERMAQTERAAALISYLQGDAKRAVQLLEPRFKLYEKSAEGDSPRRAALWLQRALYEVEFDAKAATLSLGESRAIFARLGGAKPHLAALLGYADARISGDKAAIRAAEEAVDTAWFRPRPRAVNTPWQMPLMASV